MKAHDLICNVFFLLVIHICIFPHTCIQPRAFQLAERLTHRIQWMASTFITSLWCTNFPPICCGLRACVYMFTCVWGTSVCVHVHAYGGPSEVLPAFFKSTAALLDFVFSPRQFPTATQNLECSRCIGTPHTRVPSKGSVAKNTYCSHRGPEIGSQHLCLDAHKHL